MDEDQNPYPWGPWNRAPGVVHHGGAGVRRAKMNAASHRHGTAQETEPWPPLLFALSVLR
jgi:hypothetical protein